MFWIVHFGSAAAFQRFKLPKQFWLIQVLGDAEGPFPDARGADRVLQLRFDDVHDGSPGLCPADAARAFPHDAVLVEKEMAPGATEMVRLFGLKHAVQILRFADEARTAQDGLELIVHCLGGASRSPAIAFALSEWAHVAVADMEPGTHALLMNPRVSRIMRQAVAGERRA